jgi:hypothetical protein
MRIKEEAPHTFGWLRRKELDQLGGEAYERPDGSIYLFRPGATHWVRRIVVSKVSAAARDPQSSCGATVSSRH